MCGFFAFASSLSGKEIAKMFEVEEMGLAKREIESYKFYPRSKVPTVSKNSPNQLVMRYWSLIPRWLRDDPMRMKFSTFNAKAEGIERKAAYRAPWRMGQRCLIPATWFYEFETVRDEEGKVVKKLPYRAQLRGEEVMGLAGLYEIWKDAEEREIESCTMITCEAKEPVRNIHARQPVVIRKDDWDRWLDKETKLGEVKEMLKGSGELEMFRISSEFNKAREDEVTREMVEPVDS